MMITFHPPPLRPFISRETEPTPHALVVASRVRADYSQAPRTRRPLVVLMRTNIHTRTCMVHGRCFMSWFVVTVVVTAARNSGQDHLSFVFAPQRPASIPLFVPSVCSRHVRTLPSCSCRRRLVAFYASVDRYMAVRDSDLLAGPLVSVRPWLGSGGRDLLGGRNRQAVVVVVVVMVVVSAWSTSGAHSRPANPKEERQRRGDDGMCCRLYQPSFPGIIMVATTHTFARCMALLHGFVRHSRRHRGPQLRQDLLFCVRSKRAGRNSSRGRSARPFSRALQVQHLYCSRLRHLRRRLRHWPDRGIGRLDEVGRIRGGGCGLFSFVRSFVRATAAGQLVRRLVTMIHSARRQPRLLVALTCVVHSPRRRRHVSFRHNVHGMSLFVGLDKWVRYHIHQC
jgi:hypothetical protein